MTDVLDKGPHDPKPLTAEEKLDPDAVKKFNADVAECKAWHEANKEPVKVVMPPIDAQHAVKADPERYSIIPDVFVPTTVEERLTACEARLDKLDPPKAKA